MCSGVLPSESLGGRYKGVKEPNSVSYCWWRCFLIFIFLSGYTCTNCWNGPVKVERFILQSQFPGTLIWQTFHFYFQIRMAGLRNMTDQVDPLVAHTYEGHSLCFAIWFVNNTYNHSVYSSFSACTHLTILSNQLSMTPNHVDWGMSKMMPLMNARASSPFWNCFPVRCHLTEWNKNQSQWAKSGE